MICIHNLLIPQWIKQVFIIHQFSMCFRYCFFTVFLILSHLDWKLDSRDLFQIQALFLPLFLHLFHLLGLFKSMTAFDTSLYLVKKIVLQFEDHAVNNKDEIQQYSSNYDIVEEDANHVNHFWIVTRVKNLACQISNDQYIELVHNLNSVLIGTIEWLSIADEDQ